MVPCPNVVFAGCPRAEMQHGAWPLGGKVVLLSSRPFIRRGYRGCSRGLLSCMGSRSLSVYAGGARQSLFIVEKWQVPAWCRVQQRRRWAVAGEAARPRQRHGGGTLKHAGAGTGRKAALPVVKKGRGRRAQWGRVGQTLSRW